MIPDLAESGYLPVGRYLAPAREVEERFVTNERRVDLWNSLKKVMDLLEAALGKKPHIWMSGSFLSAKEVPGDIDIVVLLDSSVVPRLSVPAQYLVDIIAHNMLKTEFDLDIDSFVLEVRSPEDASDAKRGSKEDRYLHDRGYWDNLWSATRDEQGKLIPCTRGYLEVMADAG